MITLCVHWVPEPKLIPKTHGVPIESMLRLLSASAPGCRKVFLTDQDGPDPAGWEVIRVKRRDENVMGHMMRSRAESAMQLGDRIVFLDADTLVVKPLDDLFRGDWSMMVPWFPKYLSGVMFTKDAIFAKEFFQKAADRIRDMEPCYQLFGADLAVTKDMIIENDAGIRKEQCSVICETAPDTLDEYLDWSPSGYLVNFKGTRKKYMKVAASLC